MKTKLLNELATYLHSDFVNKTWSEDEINGARMLLVYILHLQNKQRKKE
jgi:hypothetical protein